MRQRNNRIRRFDEPTAEKRTPKKCSKCGGLGHNKKTCKGPGAIDENRRRCKLLNMFICWYYEKIPNLICFLLICWYSET